MKIKNLKLVFRLGLGFGLVMLLLCIITFVGIRNMSNIQSKLDRIYNVNNVRIAIANDMLSSISTISLDLRNLLLATDQAAKNASYNRIVDQREKYAQSLKQLKELDQTAEGKNLIKKVEEALANAVSSNDKVIELGMANNFSEALPVMLNESGPAMDEVDQALKEIITYQQGRNKFRYEEATSLYSRARVIMFAVSGVALILSVLISLLLTRSICKPVAELVKAANTASSGDLTAEIKVDTTDEVGQLARAFKDMITQMRELAGQIIEKAGTVSSAAQQLSANSEQTSASANETSATMTEIASTVEQVASNIQVVAMASQTANEHAYAGNNGIVKVTEQMRAITASVREASKVIGGLNQKSQEINQIVELITGIADQTNLLALNAAIEAVRAGEQGRGFAVVAEEVRKLAEQSATAAKEIKDLIGAIQFESQRAVESMADGGREVEAGTLVVQEVGQSFKQIISAVGNLTSQIQDVASATEEMSAGVQNVAATTEEQTAAMEEVSSSADSLTNIAFELNNLVGRFKI